MSLELLSGTAMGVSAITRCRNSDAAVSEATSRVRADPVSRLPLRRWVSYSSDINWEALDMQ